MHKNVIMTVGIFQSMSRYVIRSLDQLSLVRLNNSGHRATNLVGKSRFVKLVLYFYTIKSIEFTDRKLLKPSWPM